MAKSNDGPSYLDVLSNELEMNIFHMLTSGPDGIFFATLICGEWGGVRAEGGETRGRKVFERHCSIVRMHSYMCYCIRHALSSSSFSDAGKWRWRDEEMIGWESYQCYVEYDTWGWERVDTWGWERVGSYECWKWEDYDSITTKFIIVVVNILMFTNIRQ